MMDGARMLALLEAAKLPLDPKAVLAPGASVREHFAARRQADFGAWLRTIKGEMLQQLFAESWELAARVAPATASWTF